MRPNVVPMWNTYGLSAAGIAIKDNTNNKIEGTNRLLKVQIPHKRPSVTVFSKCLVETVFPYQRKKLEQRRCGYIEEPVYKKAYLCTVPDDYWDCPFRIGYLPKSSLPALAVPERDVMVPPAVSTKYRSNKRARKCPN